MMDAWWSSPSVVFLSGPEFARNATADDAPFMGSRPAGFVHEVRTVEPLVWEGDQA